MAAIEEVEEHVRRGGLVVAATQLTEADVVDDEPFSARPAAKSGFVGLICEPGVEVVDQVDAAGVTDLDLPLAGTQRERLQDVALAGAALAGDEEILAVVDEAEGREALDDGAVEVLLERPVKGLEGLADPQTAGDDASLDAALPELLGAIAQHALEEHEGGWVVLVRPGKVRIEGLVEFLQPESLEVVSEPLEDTAVSSGLRLGSAPGAG